MLGRFFIQKILPPLQKSYGKGRGRERRKKKINKILSSSLFALYILKIHTCTFLVHLQSLGILGSLPAAALIVSLFCLLLYLMSRCCDRKPRPAHSITSLKVTLSIVTCKYRFHPFNSVSMNENFKLNIFYSAIHQYCVAELLDWVSIEVD